MHNNRHNKLAILAIAAGVVVILSIVLPTQFWWLVFAICLIGFGVWLLRCH